MSSVSPSSRPRHSPASPSRVGLGAGHLEHLPGMDPPPGTAPASQPFTHHLLSSSFVSDVSLLFLIHVCIILYSWFFQSSEPCGAATRWYNNVQLHCHHSGSKRQASDLSDLSDLSISFSSSSSSPLIFSSSCSVFAFFLCKAWHPAVKTDPTTMHLPIR